MRKLGARLIGLVEEVPFEERIFHFALLLAVCMTAFGWGMDFFYYHDNESGYVNFAFMVFWIHSYYFSRFRGRFKQMSAIAVGVLVFIFIPYNWMVTSGSSGIIPYYTIAFTVFVSIVLSGKLRLFMTGSMLIVEMLLILRDAYIISPEQLAIARYVKVTDFIIGLAIIMISTTVIVIFYSNTYKKEKTRSETYAETISQHYNQQLYYMENLEAVIDRLRAERHDFNNHLGVIYGLLKTGGSDEAVAYTEQLVNSAGKYQPIVHIPYPAIRAMLNYKLSAAKEEGVKLNLSIQLPEHLPLAEFDLTVILGNLLDNATEACQEMEEGKRYIDLSIRYQPDYLIIQIENPVNEAAVATPDGKTNKPDEENHGFGLRNIAYLAEKNHGFLKTSMENGVFHTDIAILVGTVPY